VTSSAGFAADAFVGAGFTGAGFTGAFAVEAFAVEPTEFDLVVTGFAAAFGAGFAAGFSAAFVAGLPLADFGAGFAADFDDDFIEACELDLPAGAFADFLASTCCVFFLGGGVAFFAATVFTVLAFTAGFCGDLEEMPANFLSAFFIFCIGSHG
jgi:hypothetical protein